VASAPIYNVTEWEWRIDENDLALHNSSMQLSDPQGEFTGFFFDSSLGTIAGIDVVGSFKVYLRVKDETEVWSPETLLIENAIPDQALHVQMTWDTPDGDVDLHMTKNGDPYCGDNTCYYSTCSAGQFESPEWDGQAGQTEGDPVLDIDDVDGFGPENINIDSPVDGTYRVLVHNFLVDQSTGITVKIFVDGGLQYESFRELPSTSDSWEVADIVWANGDADILPLDTVGTQGSCFGG